MARDAQLGTSGVLGSWQGDTIEGKFEPGDLQAKSIKP